MLCLSALTLLPCSPLDQIDVARAAGFDGVELRLRPGMDGDIDVMADAALQRAIDRRLAATGLQVGGVEVVRLAPDGVVADFAPLLHYAGDIGARGVQVTSVPVADADARTEQALARRLGELGELAARHGVRVQLEFMLYRGIVRSIEDAARITAASGRPNVGICVDALHLHRSGGTPRSLAGIDAGRLVSLQLCDAPRDPPASLADEARNDRLHPGEGDLPLHELLRAMPHVPYIGVEVPSRAHAGWPLAARAEKAARTARVVIDASRRASGTGERS